MSFPRTSRTTKEGVPPVGVLWRVKFLAFLHICCNNAVSNDV
jgi:hypothetical protein